MDEIIVKPDLIKIENFSEKDSIKRIRKKSPRLGEKFRKGTFNKEPLSKIFKEHFTFNNKKANNQIVGQRL